MRRGREPAEGRGAPTVVRLGPPTVPTRLAIETARARRERASTSVPGRESARRGPVGHGEQAGQERFRS